MKWIEQGYLISTSLACFANKYCTCWSVVISLQLNAVELHRPVLLVLYSGWLLTVIVKSHILISTMTFWSNESLHIYLFPHTSPFPTYSSTITDLIPMNIAVMVFFFYMCLPNKVECIANHKIIILIGKRHTRLGGT